jgi:hypothetical protein
MIELVTTVEISGNSGFFDSVHYQEVPDDSTLGGDPQDQVSQKSKSPPAKGKKGA